MSTCDADPKIIVAIPCFNEERFIGSVVAKAKKYASQVIVVDDGSTDASAEIAEEVGATVFRHGCNFGYGAAIISALSCGKEHDADVLVILDGDGQHDPREIPYLIEPVLEGKSDIVIGSRFLDKKCQAPFYRRLGQRVLTVATNVATSSEISDSQSGCRAYSKKALQELNLTENGMAVSSEILVVANDNELRLSEVPIDVHYEERAKRNPVLHGSGVLARIMVLLSLRYPLVLFGVPGLIFLTIGIGFGVRALFQYDPDGPLPIGGTLMAILLSLIGILGIFTALILQAMKELLQKND